MRLAEGLVVGGVGDENDLRLWLAPARQFACHRDGKKPVVLAMDDEHRQLALREALLRMPDGRNEACKRTRNPNGDGGVAERGEGFAENEAPGAKPINDCRGHAATQREAENRDGQCRSEFFERGEGGDPV